MIRSKPITISLTLVIFLSLLSGCLNPEHVDSEPKVLRVLGFEWAVKRYKTHFELAHENVTIEIIDVQKVSEELRNSGEDISYSEKIREIITGSNPPDVIYLEYATMLNYIDEELIIPLDNYISKDNFDLDEIAAPIIKAIRDGGNGSIYALPPTFISMALYYNKEFFDKMNLPYPEGIMTWEEIFDLARALTHEEDGKKYYGLSFDPNYDPYSQMELYMEPLQLSMFDYDFTNFTVNTPQWQEVWETYTQLYKDEIIPPGFKLEETELSFFEREPFYLGRVAMLIGEYNKMDTLRTILGGNVYYPYEKEQPVLFEWDLAPFPIHPSVGQKGGGYLLYAMTAINSSSDQPDLAWEYVSFMNGDKMAQAEAERGFELVSRMKHLTQPAELNVDLDAFIALEPILIPSAHSFLKQFPDQNIWDFKNIGIELMEKVLNDELTVEEALNEFQTQGEKLLDEIWFEMNQ